MFHELGHALTAWCFGHFAIPKFDRFNGGGVTEIYPRSIIISVFVYAFIIANYFYIKKYSTPYYLKKWWILLIVFSIAFFTELHFDFITFMGKGGELIFSLLAAWYGLSLCRLKTSFKATFYLTLSMILWINSVKESIMLIFNDEEKSKYLYGKIQTLGGDPAMNDLLKLEKSSGLSIDFFNAWLLILAFLTMYKIIKMSNIPFVSKIKFYQYIKQIIDSILHPKKSNGI